MVLFFFYINLNLSWLEVYKVNNANNATER